MTTPPAATAPALGITPSGRLHLSEGGEFPLPAPLARRIERAFARGPGHGLLHLGGAELQAELPPDLAYFRDLGRRFLTRLCALPDLDAQPGPLTVEVPPPADLDQMVDSAPPMAGAEYLDAAVLAGLWAEMTDALSHDLREGAEGIQGYLRRMSPVWNLVGRVCFHLVENKRNPDAPFAFLATYAARLAGTGGRVQHRPLQQALTDSAEAADRQGMLALLLPVQKAAAQSPFLADLLDSREIFHPLAWTPQEAYRFLQDVPLYEASGIVVRVPEFWQARSATRPRVQATIGRNQVSRLGTAALLDFSVNVTLGEDEKPLSEQEWQEVLHTSTGLALIRGRWVEIDRDKLSAALDHWKKLQREAARGGLPFIEAMRLLAGARLGGGDERGGASAEPLLDSWSQVHAGKALAEVLEGLRHPEGLAGAQPGPELHATLRPYQEVGVRWLYFLYRLGLGACLADDMGLGKTIQVLALLLCLRREQAGPALLVAPASLLANWQAEARRFTPDLRVLVAHPSAQPAAELGALVPEQAAGYQLVVTSYGMVSRLPWLAQVEWAVVALDEAQAIKNPAARQTRAVKALLGRTRLALTGTPIENRLSDLWSLFDFLCPGLLGSAQAFGRFVKRLGQDGQADYGPLRTLIRPYLLRRRKTDRSIIADLPDKTEMLAYCPLTQKQAVLYQQAVAELESALADQELEGMKRRGLILAFLMRFKQICNHPAQWLGSGVYEAGESGKFARLRELCEVIASRQEKVLVFTQFREMVAPLCEALRQVFARPGLGLHGQTPVKQRQALVKAFQDEDGPPFLVLSLKAGGTGLNLTAAAHVIHFDRWWNPAVEQQATDRAYRIGQKKNVLVHKFVCRGTVEEKIDALITAKLGLAQELLGQGNEGEGLITEMNNEELLRLVRLDMSTLTEDT